MSQCAAAAGVTVDTVETAGRATYGLSFRHTMPMKIIEFNPCLVCSGNKQLL